MNSKLITIIALIIGLIIAIVMAVQVGQGEFKTVYITTVLLFSIPVLLLLGLRSWYLLPFAMLADLPALPLFAGRSLSLAEMGITMFSGLMVLAVIQGRHRFRIKIPEWWPMLFFGGWVLFIAVINGGGLAILGSSVMGSRKYLTVLIALVAMIMLSQVTIREKEARRVCLLIFAAMSLTGMFLAAKAFMGSMGHEATYEFYSWQQSLSFISLGGITLLFARHRPSKVVGSPLYLAAFIILMAVVIFSGKRMLFATCCVIPVAACFWHKQTIFAFVAVMLGTLAVIGAVVTQNHITEIPKSMQRVLAFIPADWDWQVEQSTVNTFRETLNRWAMKRVDADPLIGRGVTMSGEDFRIMNDKNYVNEIKDPEDDPQAFPHIAAQSWHSTWLGLAASLGIPAAIAWIMVQIFVLRKSWKLGHTHDMPLWSSTLMAMIFFLMVFGVLRSLSTGDVTILAMDGGLFLGLMSAVKNGLKEQRWEEQQEQLQFEIEQRHRQEATA